MEAAKPKTKKKKSAGESVTCVYSLLQGGGWGCQVHPPTLHEGGRASWREGGGEWQGLVWRRNGEGGGGVREEGNEGEGGGSISCSL